MKDTNTNKLIINQLTKEQYKNLGDTKAKNELYDIIDDEHFTSEEISNLLNTKQNKLTAGTGIEITEENVINNTQTSAEWGNIQGNILDQSDLLSEFGKKQDTLTAGNNIEINENVISANIPTVLVDDITITKDDDNIISTIGTKTKSNGLLYNWVGTNEQYDIDISNGTITEDTQCIITDDVIDDLKYIPIAKNDVLGLVQPDGTSITINEHGVISSKSGTSVTIRKW